MKETPSRHVWSQAVLDGDLKWTQCREGYSLDTLDETIALVTRHGIEIREIMCSPFRHQTLIPHFDIKSWEWGSEKIRAYKGCEFLVWECIPYEVMYIVGDVWPQTPESVAVMIWRRPQTKVTT